MGRGKRRESRGSLSRRDFLRALGTGAAMAASPLSRVDADEEKGPPRVLGPGPAPLAFELNGERIEIEVEPRATLLSVLRDRLGHLGAKEACDRGACGACTVLIDGLSVNACLFLAMDAAGSSVRTVEGLATGGELSPLQRAFVAKDGMQCGFCTSGFLMSLTALLDANPNPSPEEIRAACAGNLCRCAAYPGIFAAANAVAAGEPLEPDANLSLRERVESLGLPRIDGPEKVSGRATFVSDVCMEGQETVRTISCPFARASLAGRPRLRGARTVPGVTRIEVVESDSYELGQTVAWAVARDPAAADEALAALGLRFEPALEGEDLLDQFDRADPAGSYGDLRAAERELARAAAISEGLYQVQALQHSCLEPHGSVSAWNQGQLSHHESTQAVCGVRDTLAAWLELAQEQVHVECLFTGGGFGSKLEPWIESFDTAVRARELGIPLRHFASRSLELSRCGGRSPLIVRTKLGADKDGRILAEVRKSFGEHPNTGDEYWREWYPIPTVYWEWVELPLEGYGNFPPLRAPGVAELQFVTESMVDDLAFRLGMDPLVFRLRNDPSLAEWFEIGAQAIGWDRRTGSPGSGPGPKKRGFGVGCGEFAAMRGCHFAEVEVDVETGEVRVVKIVAVEQADYLNRLTAESQIRGGAIMGMSWALLEERVGDPSAGGMLNTNFDTYKFAGSLDVPEIEVVLLGSHGGAGGLGEAPVTPIGGAIANAIFDATGVRVYQMPFTPRNMLAALRGD